MFLGVQQIISIEDASDKFLQQLLNGLGKCTKATLFAHDQFNCLLHSLVPYLSRGGRVMAICDKGENRSGVVVLFLLVKVIYRLIPDDMVYLLGNDRKKQPLYLVRCLRIIMNSLRQQHAGGELVPCFKQLESLLSKSVLPATGDQERIEAVAQMLQSSHYRALFPHQHWDTDCLTEEKEAAHNPTIMLNFARVALTDHGDGDATEACDRSPSGPSPGQAPKRQKTHPKGR